jgi:hypothetical protein
MKVRAEDSKVSRSVWQFYSILQPLSAQVGFDIGSTKAEYGSSANLHMQGVHLYAFLGKT